MKNLAYFTFFLIGSLTMTGCWIDDDTDIFGCVNGDGPIVSEEIFLADFDGIELNMDADVFISQGPEQSVVIEGKANIIDEIDRDVNGGVWEIEADRCIRDVDQLNVFITVPDLRLVRISGSGTVFGETDFELGDGDIDLLISGSGEIDLGLFADDINANISGSGRMVLTGEGDELDVRISGSGDIRAFDFPVRAGDIVISGSGDAEVRVSESLLVRISGSGDVYYKGNPSIDVHISGSGDLIDAN